MLTITGQFQGKTYEQQSISALQLAKEFGVPTPPTGTEVLEHRILQKKIKVNLADKQPVSPRSYSVPAHFTASHNGETFTLRYSTGPGRKTKDGTTFTPDHVTFAGKTMAFQAKDYDKFLYMFLHPFNNSSPFVGKNPQIEYYDPKAAAIAAQMAANRQAEMNMAIWNADKTSDEKIRMKAAGIIVRGQGITVSKNIPTATLRQSLATLFQKFPEDFIQAWNSDITVLNGLLNDAIDKGIIEHVPNTGAGRQGWIWRKGNSAGNVAVYTSPNDDVRRTLQSYASQPQNYDAVMEYLTRLLDTDTAKEVFDIEQPAGAGLRSVTAPANPWEVKVNEAISTGVIGFDMATKQVRFVDEEGNFTDQKPMVENTTAKDWVKATISFFQSQQSVWHKGELKKRLTEPQPA